MNTLLNKFDHRPREIQKLYSPQDSSDNDSIAGIDDSVEGVTLS